MFALKADKIVQTQGLNDLSGSVGSEIEHQEGITVLHHGVLKTCWFEEFIGDSVPVAVAEDGFGFALIHVDVGIGVEPVSLVCSLPALVPIHRPIAAAKAGNGADACGLKAVLDSFDVAGCTLGWGVTSIGDHMNRNLGNSSFCCPPDHTAEVVDVAVDAAIGTQSE